MVLANLCSVLHDEEIYPNPHQFRPERFLKPDGSFNKEYIDKIPIFGLGKRRCIGQYLGRIELFYFLSDLITRFRFRAVSDHLPSLEGSLGILWQPEDFVIIAEERSNSTKLISAGS